MRFVRIKDIVALAESRIIRGEYGATYAHQYIGIWVSKSGDDKQRNRRTRRFLGTGVIKPTRANQKEKEAGYDLAEQLLADARTELSMRKK